MSHVHALPVTWGWRCLAPTARLGCPAAGFARIAQARAAQAGSRNLGRVRTRNRRWHGLQPWRARVPGRAEGAWWSCRFRRRMNNVAKRFSPPPSLPAGSSAVAQGAPRCGTAPSDRRSGHPHQVTMNVAGTSAYQVLRGGGVAAFVLAVVAVAAVLIFNARQLAWLMAPAARCALSPVPKLRSTVPCWALTSCCWPAWTGYWICRRCGRNGWTRK